jgi:hypothetical protein
MRPETGAGKGPRCGGMLVAARDAVCSKPHAAPALIPPNAGCGGAQTSDLGLARVITEII